MKIWTLAFISPGSRPSPMPHVETVDHPSRLLFSCTLHCRCSCCQDASPSGVLAARSSTSRLLRVWSQDALTSVFVQLVVHRSTLRGWSAVAQGGAHRVNAARGRHQRGFLGSCHEGGILPPCEPARCLLCGVLDVVAVVEIDPPGQFRMVRAVW